MPAGSVSFRHLILGLLTQQPMTGYDIRRVLQSLGWLVGNPSFGSLYPTLHALLKDGLVTVAVTPRQEKPSRKVYSITDAGKQELQEWIDHSVVSNASLKAFVMRLILADNYARPGLVAHLQQRHVQVTEHHAALEQAARTLDECTNWQRLALDYGLALATAELAWLNSTLNRLSQRPLPMEATQDN
jgi:PadR family transcriptional regulator AphA